MVKTPGSVSCGFKDIITGAKLNIYISLNVNTVLKLPKWSLNVLLVFLTDCRWLFLCANIKMASFKAVYSQSNNKEIPTKSSAERKD